MESSEKSKNNDVDGRWKSEPEKVSDNHDQHERQDLIIAGDESSLGVEVLIL